MKLKFYCSEKRSGKENIMANNAITNGQIKLGHVYCFRNKAYPKYALNVWSDKDYPQAKLSNVCLWEYDETDIAQKWVIKNSTPSYIQPLKGSSFNLYLDRYTGSGAGAGINAHLYTPSDTSLFDILTASQDSVKIKVANKKLYLTAYGGTNGNRTGKTAKSEGNVFFAANSNSPTQEWIPVEVNTSSGNKNYVTYPCSYMKILQNPFALTSGNSNSHYYYSDASANYHDYPIDEACEDKNRSWFYCPCDEMEIKRIYGVGESGKTNTIWLRSTSKVKMPCGEDYLVLMIMHPEDDDLRTLSVGQRFKRGETIFREGMNGNATGNHFHMSSGKGDLSSNGWKENTNGRWVLTTTNGTIEPQEAFYVDKDFTTENNNGGISFTYLPE